MCSIFRRQRAQFLPDYKLDLVICVFKNLSKTARFQYWIHSSFLNVSSLQLNEVRQQEDVPLRADLGSADTWAAAERGRPPAMFDRPRPTTATSRYRQRLVKGKTRSDSPEMTWHTQELWHGTTGKLPHSLHRSTFVLLVSNLITWSIWLILMYHMFFPLSILFHYLYVVVCLLFIFRYFESVCLTVVLDFNADWVYSFIYF